MAYNKHTWTTQELITADKLNNIEDGVDGSIKTQPDIKSGEYTLETLNNNKIANLSNIYNYMGIQELVIDPRTGYRYLFDHDGSGHSLENLVIIEFDQLLRFRSNMKVTHGNTKTSWLHGQFVQFDYYNTDQDKVSFLIGGPGESVRLEYKPYTTVNYDDLPVFFTVNEKDSYTQAVDFDNNVVVSVLLNKDTVAKTYTFNFNTYSLNPVTGETNSIKNYTDTIDIPNGYSSQGISAAPARSYLNRESDGTMIFLTAGGTEPDGQYNEMSIRVYLIENGLLTPFATITNLENADLFSTSNTEARSSYIAERQESDPGKYVKDKEVEGSSQVKIGDKWVFTTSLMAAKDTRYYDSQHKADKTYSPRNLEKYQLAFGDSELIDTLRNIGKPEFTNYMGIESMVDNLYTIYMPGRYQISPTKLPDLKDAPYMLRQGLDKDTIGGTGLSSIQLDVSYQGLYGHIKQVLTLQTYSYNTYSDLKFERVIRTDFKVGIPNKYGVGMWEMTPINLIGNWDIFPQVKKTTELLIPGSKKFIAGDKLASFFVDDAFLPIDAGVLEVLPTSILPEGNGSTTRIIQKFTTYGATVHTYKRSITVKTEQVGSLFPAGIGGGYPGYSSVGAWKEASS